MDASSRDLVVVEDEGICDDDVLATGSSEDDDFSDIVRCERLNAAIELLIAHPRFSVGSVLTHRRRQPWPCHHQSEQWRIPIQTNVSHHLNLRSQE